MGEINVPGVIRLVTMYNISYVTLVYLYVTTWV